MPIQRKAENLIWIKHFLKQNKLSRENLGLQLYTELVIMFGKQTLLLNPNLLVLRLSGYRSIGLTEVQAAKMSKMEPTFYHYQFLNILHFIMEQIEENKLQFPILVQFLDQSQKTNLTHSTEKTYSLLKQGYSVTDIMSIRRLKKSTIEDHLVELALHNKEFSDRPICINGETAANTKGRQKRLNSKQLKQINIIRLKTQIILK